MRVSGHNVLAILVAALAMYLIEFLIFAVAISPAQFMAMSGMSAEQGAAIGLSRMPLGPLMPILAAIGLSLAIKWRGAQGVHLGAGAGAATGLILALLLGFSSRMYGYVYGPHTEAYLLIDLGRYLVTYGVAGAILGAWK